MQRSLHAAGANSASQQLASTSYQPAVAPRPVVPRRHAEPAPSKQAARHQQRVATVVSFQNDASMAMPMPGATAMPEMLTGSKTKTLSWAGAGIFFFWQLGAIKFLSERYDLSKVPMIGASGGALASLLGLCGVPADLALRRAYEFAKNLKIWERPLGLMGIWGSLVEDWLDSLLPDDAAERCSGHLTIVVTTLPTMAQVGISQFKDKKDLINCAMASSHIPLFLDYKFARYCRGKYCIDGSFPDFFTNDNSELLKNGGAAVMFDYFDDKNLQRKGRLDMIESKTYEEVCHIMDLGYNYAQKLHDAGQFDHLEMGGMVLDHLEAAEKSHDFDGAQGPSLPLQPFPSTA